MKKKQKELLETFDPLKTEEENMYLNGFAKIWNCGTIKVEY